MWTVLGHEPLSQTARWQPEPDTRGTFNILSTCLTTLVMCAWTAIHLNIPANRKTSHKKWHKVWWLVLGLLTPETVAIIAFQQWLGHLSLTKAMNDNLKKLGPTQGNMAGLEANQTSAVDDTQENHELLPGQTQRQSFKHRRYHWTPIHSFYALMGGFVFDNSRNPGALSFDGGREQVPICRELLVWLAQNEPEMIPDISSEYIKDKSKANGFTKLLVCVQMGWFGIQVITRLGQGLSVTLLELNVFAHVFFALLTFVFWWGKPLDIDEPTAIFTDDPKVNSIYAAFWSRTSLGEHTPLAIRRGGHCKTQPIWDVKGKVVTVDQVVFSPQRAHELWINCFDGISASQQGIRYFSNQRSSFEDVSLRLTVNGAFSGYGQARIFIELDVNLVKLLLERSKIQLDKGVLDAEDRVYVVFKYCHLQRHLFAYTHPAGLGLLNTDLPGMNFRKMRPRVRNWPGLKTGGTTEDFVLDVALHIAASVLYSAWHLTAWNDTFSTAVESILWKVSAIGVASSLILEEILFFVFLPFVFRRRDDALSGDYQKKPLTAPGLLFEYSGYGVFLFTCLFGGLTCCILVFSRVYLVVESFISLGFAPDGVFAVAPWSSYIPHIN